MGALETILLISLVMAIFNQLAFMKIVDIKEYNELRGSIKEKRGKIKGLDAKHPDYSKEQNELMSLSLKMTRLSLKPSMYTILPFWFVFIYLQKSFSSAGTIFTIFSYSFGWLGTYLIFSLLFSLATRKAFEKYLWH